ncbi:MAG: ABC transporter permease [Planctomycetota bacterium]|jgi:D-methionine transport system permease protein|nr:ABC transporter permease [Planctomycetota bacterium]
MDFSKLATLLWQASWETFYVVALSSLFAAIIGVPLGVLLLITRRGHIKPQRWINGLLGFIVNATRSVPFIIFIIAIIPLTRFLVRTSIGPTAVIVPLTLAAAVLVARLTETALAEVPHTIIEAAQSFGATTWQIIWRVLLPEALPGLLQMMTLTVITLIAYSAMAGAVGGGGLGDLGIRYGYQRYQWEVMLSTVVLLMAAVQAVQFTGDRLTRRFARRREK